MTEVVVGAPEDTGGDGRQPLRGTVCDVGVARTQTGGANQRGRGEQRGVVEKYRLEKR